MTTMPPIKTVGDLVLFLIAACLILPLLAAVIMFEFWLGVRIVTLLLDTEYILAFGWTLVFTIVFTVMGMLNSAVGNRR